MADFCHDWEPGGLGCPHKTEDGTYNLDKPTRIEILCPSDGQCFGDFQEAVETWKTKLDTGHQVVLGICEGHGTGVFLHREEDGIWFEHDVDLCVNRSNDENASPMEPIPPRRRVKTISAEPLDTENRHGS